MYNYQSERQHANVFREPRPCSIFFEPESYSPRYCSTFFTVTMIPQALPRYEPPQLRWPPVAAETFQTKCAEWRAFYAARNQASKDQEAKSQANANPEAATAVAIPSGSSGAADTPSSTRVDTANSSSVSNPTTQHRFHEPSNVPDARPQSIPSLDMGASVRNSVLMLGIKQPDLGSSESSSTTVDEQTDSADKAATQPESSTPAAAKMTQPLTPAQCLAKHILSFSPYEIEKIKKYIHLLTASRNRASRAIQASHAQVMEARGQYRAAFLSPTAAWFDVVYPPDWTGPQLHHSSQNPQSKGALVAASTADSTLAANPSTIHYSHGAAGARLATYSGAYLDTGGLLRSRGGYYHSFFDETTAGGRAGGNAAAGRGTSGDGDGNFKQIRETEPYAVHCILVRCAGAEWVVARRFSEFEALLRGLHRNEIPGLPELPPKTLRRQLSYEFLERRQRQLHTFLQALLKSPYRMPERSLVRKFLELDRQLPKSHVTLPDGGNFGFAASPQQPAQFAPIMNPVANPALPSRGLAPPSKYQQLYQQQQQQHHQQQHQQQQNQQQ